MFMNAARHKYEMKCNMHYKRFHNNNKKVKSPRRDANKSE